MDTSARTEADNLGEDEVKETLVLWLARGGWSSKLAWGRQRVINIEAARGGERWIIEVTGCGSRAQCVLTTSLPYWAKRLDGWMARMHAIRLRSRTWASIGTCGVGCLLWERPGPEFLHYLLSTPAQSIISPIDRNQKRIELLYGCGWLYEGARVMGRCYVPSRGPDAWQALLAKPDEHWKTGYSARTLAYSWEAHDGLPEEISSLIKTIPRYANEDPELLMAIPKWKVPLPGGSKAS